VADNLSVNTPAGSKTIRAKDVAAGGVLTHALWEQPYNTIGHDAKTVTTAATPVNLSAQACSVVFITAPQTNTGIIAWGGSNTVRASGTVKGDQLEPGAKLVLAVSNLNLLWIDAAISGEGIVYTWTDLV